MILKRLFRPREMPEQRLYEAIVAAARHTNFYENMGVPDTIEGRFEMVVLHLFLVLRRLKSADVEKLRQSLTDMFFSDMDGSLREFGVSDVTVGKKIRKLAESYYGRVTAYDKALNSSIGNLEAAIGRNIYPDGAPENMINSMANYVVSAIKILEQQSHEQITKGDLKFQ